MRKLPPGRPMGGYRTTYTTPLARRLCLARAELGATLHEVASAIGITVRGLQKLEAGDSRPSLDTACALANLYGMTVEQLIDGEQLASAK